MAKITLGTRPKNFKQTIKVALPEGGEGTIEMSYIYRTRTEWGQFIDARLQTARDSDAATAAAKAAAPVDQVPPAFSMADEQRTIRDVNVAYIMAIADGWDIPDQPFSLEAVTQLCDELPSVALAIINEYRAAIVGARSGN